MNALLIGLAVGTFFAFVEQCRINYRLLKDVEDLKKQVNQCE